MTTICVKVSEEQIKYLKKLGHQLSLERNQDLTLSDLIREAINKTYPMPKEKSTK